MAAWLGGKRVGVKRRGIHFHGPGICEGEPEARLGEVGLRREIGVDGEELQPLLVERPRRPVAGKEVIRRAGGGKGVRVGENRIGQNPERAGEGRGGEELAVSRLAGSDDGLARETEIEKGLLVGVGKDAGDVRVAGGIGHGQGRGRGGGKRRG